MAYISAIKGYIVDVPNAIFTRTDLKRFYFNKLASCNFSPAVEPIIINGGQSLFPVAYINGASSAEVTLTSAEFRGDLFEIAHGATASAAIAETIVGAGSYIVSAGLTITLPTAVDNVYITSLDEVAVTLAAGKFTVTPVVEAAGPPIVPAHTLITFFTGDVAEGDIVEASYELTVAGTLIPVSGEGTSANGSLQLSYPVYSSSDDTTENSKKGTLILTIYKVRVSAMPGFDSSLTYRFPAQKCA